MARGLDHVVHAVRDLDAAADLYRRLGFTVGARNRHPWGTHNHIVQLPGFFVELLSVGESESILAAGPHQFAFGEFTRRFLAGGDGLAMLVLESADADADARAFRDAGIGDFDVLDFERDGKRPDGSVVKLGFSLAFATDRNAPDIGFFACQQHYPENFWDRAFQIHANTASGIAGLVLVAENPTDHHIFLSAFAGERELLATSSGIAVTTPRGVIQVMDPDAFRIHYGVEPPDVSRGGRLAALRVLVDDAAAARAVLGASAISVIDRVGGIVVAPRVAMGATIVVESR
jgi:catechol 2,3-dioxygenase-like lactoylglutathione lyase family enzyme